MGKALDRIIANPLINHVTHTKYNVVANQLNFHSWQTFRDVIALIKTDYRGEHFPGRSKIVAAHLHDQDVYQITLSLHLEDTWLLKYALPVAVA